MFPMDFNHFLNNIMQIIDFSYSCKDQKFFVHLPHYIYIYKLKNQILTSKTSDIEDFGIYQQYSNIKKIFSSRYYNIFC